MSKDRGAGELHCAWKLYCGDDACRCHQCLVKRMSSQKLRKTLSPNLDMQVTLRERHLQQPSLLLYRNLDRRVSLRKGRLQQHTFLLN